MSSLPSLESKPAPVVIFAFNRPGHLERTVQALSACAEARHSDLTIYCDGPRRREDEVSVEEVRQLASRARGFASVKVVRRPHNLGLAVSIIDGVTAQLAMHDRIVVLEDDLVVSPHFLRYMNDGLSVYRQEDRVASIHGYCYPVSVPLPETFFLRGADCWGWATWRRAWNTFRTDGEHLLRELQSRRMLHEFDMDGTYPFSQMLRDQIAGRNNSWAVRWHASCFLADQLTLYPGRSLVHNIGNDDSGTHCGETGDFSQTVASSPVAVIRQPLAPSAGARSAFVRFFRQRQGSFLRRLARGARASLARLRA